MRTFTWPVVCSALILLAGCKSTAPQRVSVGLRVHVPDPTPQGRHRSAKIPIDVMVEYEVGGEKNQPQVCDNE